MKNVNKLLLTLSLLLTFAVGQMGATITIYAVGNMQDNGGTWRDEKTTLNCHNWGISGTSWPGQSMTEWNDISVDGHQVWKCTLKDDGNTNIIFNNGSWQTSDKTISATQKAYPYPTYLNGDWYYSPRVCKALWESDQTVSGGYIYFDNSNASWSDSYMYVVVGHASWIGYYRLTALGHTKLCYYSGSSLGWNDAKFVAVAGNSSSESTGSGNPNNLTALTHYSDVISYGLNTGSTYMINMSSGTNCTPISINYESSGYSAFNYSQTVQKYTSTDGGSTYSAASINSGTVTITPYKLTDNGTVSNSSNTGTLDEASETSVSKDAVYTGEVTLTASANTGYTFVGWFAAASGGSALSTNTSYTYNAPKSTKTIYARFKENRYTVSFANDGNGTTIPSSNTTVGQITGVSISATPYGGYHFDSWSVTSGSGSFADATSSSTTFYPTANATIQASFAADAEETHDVTVSYKYGATVIKTATTESGVGVSTTRSVTAPTITGYTFSSWTLGNGLTNHSANTTTNPISITTNASGSYTLQANYTINSYNVTFNANNGTGSMSAESFNYNQTKALTANTYTRDGYVFKGWATSSANATAGTIAYADSANYTMGTANVTLYAVWYKKAYFVNVPKWTAANVKVHVFTGGDSWKTWNNSAEQMTSTGTTVFGYTIYSYEFPEIYTTVIFHNSGSNQTDDWTWTAATPYYYHGASAQYASVDAIRQAWKVYGSWNISAGNWVANSFASYGENSATYTVSLAASTSYSFQYVFSGTNTWYGCTGGTMSDGDTWTLDGGSNVSFTTTVAGTYTFTIDYSDMSSNGAPSCTLDFPTTYTLTYGFGTIVGTNGTIASSPSTASGTLLISGTTVTLTAPNAKTGYSWKGWYDNAAGTGEAVNALQEYTVTMNSNKTLYACYNETTYAVTINNGDHGTVSPTGSQQVGLEGVAITATPDAGYKFDHWTKTGEYVTLSSTTANPTTVTASGVGTVTANYIQRYILRGSLKDGSADAGMAGWAATDNSAYTSATIAGNVMTVTATLTKSKSDYKFKVFDSTLVAWRGQTGTSYIPNATSWTLNGGNEVYFRATAIGTYTFAVNFTDAAAPAITVTRPTGYPVTYGFGSVEGSNTAPTAQTAAGISFNSADSIQSGTSVTFTASAAKTGYTWQGWYTTNNTSGTKLSEGESLTYTTTVNAAKTVYAVYTEDLYTVTVTAGENGSITTGSPSVTAGIDTKPTITATADPGFRFSYWEVVTGTATITDDHSASTTVSASSNATIRAVFGSNWVVGGASDKFGNWDMSRGYSFANFETVGGKELGYVNIDLPANTEYEIKVYDHNTSAWYGHTNSIQTVTYTSNNGTALQFNSGGGYQNLRIVTAGHGTYQFVWNQTDHKLTINYPTSYTITYGQKTYYGVDESNDATTTGGTFSVVDGDDNALVSGKYIVATDAAVFTAVPASNYSLAGWYSDATCETAYVNGEDGAVITTNTLALTPSANKTVYAKFAENMTTVNIAHNAHGHVELGGATVTSLTAGAHTTRSITAVPDEGYYFAGWTVTEGSDFTPSATGEANTTITVTGNGAGETTGQTLTANFIELDKIYFRNIFDDGVNEPASWENVYVYFDAYWEEGDNKGAGAKTKPYVEMTQVGTSNVYEAYVPRAVTSAGYANVAFSNADFHDYNNFYGSKAAYRGDYNRILNMFVPFHTSSGTTNTTQYFSNGYWMQYDTKIGETAGYYLKKRTGTNTYSQLSQFEAVSNHATTIQDTLRIDNMEASNNRYRITSAGGLNYVAASQITSSNCIGIELVENNTADSYFEISPSTEGNYIIQINQEEDKMKLNVIYPISVGDHRLKHTYTSGSAKSTYSDVIKSHEDGKKLSMYFDNTTSHSPSLVLQKCTALNNGVPTWGSETAVTMTGIKTDTMGVYVFDLAVAGDAGSISNAAPYTGEYYVKADSLPGGWTNFTQNVMLLNTNTFDKSKSLTYDRYLCHWYGNRNGTYNTNIKCVVANEYNNQLTDTLFGDVVIGGADRNHQTLPFPGNVRFSYNSTTNELKRTYINGASDWRDEFLLVSGSSKIKATNGTALLGNDTTLHDENNWTYQVDIKAAANSNIILSAKFNNQRQLLLGSTSFTDSVQIVGGSSNREYNMRLVYDFKTDYLIAGYLAGGTNVDESQAIYSDVLIIREQQGNAEQINFASGQKLTEVRTVYGVMQFNKSYLTDASISRYSRNTYWISFPFDVKLSEAVGFGSYGTQWIIQYYDGAGRASKGLWKETPTYWTHVSAAEREAGFIMKANVGYILSLSLNNTSASSNIWDNGVTQVSIYFPSKDPVETIDGVLPEAGDYVVPAHPVTFAGAERDNRSYKDANWNVIGVPSYANVSKNVNETTSINENNVPFLYSYDFGTNRMRATDVSTSITFGAMQAYLVQYAGTIDWTLTTIPLGMAARRNQTAEKDTYTLCLNLDKEDENMDKTYIRFTDDATEGLDMNKDLTKNFNSGIDNIYTICEDVELAAQILPLGDETVYIPVGVKAAANGTCTFSMPDGTDGLEVYLFDRETNKHINMLISTYDADLTKGDINDRFVLEIRRAQMPTGIFTTGNVDEDVTKYMYNGHLYIKKGQCIYNAEGKRITNVQ